MSEEEKELLESDDIEENASEIQDDSNIDSPSDIDDSNNEENENTSDLDNDNSIENGESSDGDGEGDPAPQKKKGNSILNTSFLKKLKIMFPWLFGLFVAIATLLFYFILVLLIIFFLASAWSPKKKTQVGLQGYIFYSASPTATSCDSLYVTGIDNPGSYTIEELVAAIVHGEYGKANNDEMYQAMAITARTLVVDYLDTVAKDCNVVIRQSGEDKSGKLWVSFKANPPASIVSAVEATKGMIMTRNGKVFESEWSAFCYESIENDTFISCHKQFDTGENQRISKSWLETNIEKYGYRSYIQTPNQFHNRGMSQIGASYLIDAFGYNRDGVLAYYYGSNIKYASIYMAGYSGLYPINPSDEKYANLKFLNQSLESFLLSQGSSIETLNEYIYSQIAGAGIGTRDGVVTAAVTLIGALSDYGVKIPYTFGGKYSEFGANPSWGNNYRGIDCSGFIMWAIINGMQTTNVPNIQTGRNSDISAYTLLAGQKNAICNVGDVLVNGSQSNDTGHIALVIGLDDASKKYITAEATTMSISQGTGGVLIKTRAYNEGDGYRCRKLDSMYAGSYS